MLAGGLGFVESMVSQGTHRFHILRCERLTGFGTRKADISPGSY